MDRFRLRAALATLLADHGRPALLALALACAELVLPLYEAVQPGDDRLRRALRPPHPHEDLMAAHAALASTSLFGHCAQHVQDAAAAVYAAASLSFLWHPDTDIAVLVAEVLHCVRRTADAACGDLESGSAQERLDFVLQRMEGAPSFAVWLERRLHVAGESRG